MEIKVEQWLVLEDSGIFSVYPTTDIDKDCELMKAKKIRCLSSETITLTTEELEAIYK